MNINDKSALKEFIFSLCSCMSVSGFEKKGRDEVFSLLSPMFDSIEQDKIGNYIIQKNSNKQNVPKLLLDAHVDEIGLLVDEICEGGFVRAQTLGGHDKSVLIAADVTIFGKREVRGVIISEPPHLKKDASLPEFIYIDTGLCDDELRELVDIGTPARLYSVGGELKNGKIFGRAFDDKACAACLLWAVANTPADELEFDVTVILSAMEETSRKGGVVAGVYPLDVDIAVCTDVNLAKVPSTRDEETVPMGKGISISVSAATDIPLTKRAIDLCRRKEIPHVPVAAAGGTGTNSPSINLIKCGIPVVDIGLPLASMHTPCEVISLEDALTLVRFTREFMCDKTIADSAKEGKREWI